MSNTRNITWIVITVILFVLLTPGVLITIPPFRITEMKWAATDPSSLLPILIHGIIFASILVSLKSFVRKVQKKAKATGQSLIKTVATNITKNVKSVASKVTGGAISSPSPSPVASPTPTVTPTTSPTVTPTPNKPVTTATSSPATSTPATSPKK